MVKNDLLSLSATRLLELYRTREASPVEVTQQVFQRIAEVDPVFNVFCVHDEERAMDAARASEQRWLKGQPAGLVDGIPTTVKDLILAKDWPTLRGSLTIDPNQAWTEDGPPVARMREHGAIIIGKTTTPEFGWKGVTDSALSGITRNPWNPAMTTGGSSGGGPRTPADTCE